MRAFFGKQMSNLCFSRKCILGGFVSAFSLIVALLYLPFSDSPAVFDDLNIITNLAAFDYAQHFFSRYTRTFPYFSIGFVQVLSGSDLVWNRYVNVVLHGGVILSLYFSWLVLW